MNGYPISSMASAEGVSGAILCRFPARCSLHPGTRRERRAILSRHSLEEMAATCSV
jgi:hypothetical protein